MKNRFTSKKTKKFKFKFLLFIFIFTISLVYTFKYFDSLNIKIDDKTFVKYLLSNYDNSNKKKETKILKKIWSSITDVNYLNPASIIESNYSKLINKKDIAPPTKTVINEDKTPTIYIYNSHQTEEYATTTFAEYSLTPTVMMANYIIQDVFKKNNLYTTVEESSIKDILRLNNWNYASSYKASRILMENAKAKNPNLTYFIDVHRDSLTKTKTTVEIDGKSYAKTIFLIGLENPNYKENLEFTTKINNKMNELYPNLSKGIYQKGGVGVNGIYNQDFSKYTILIEIGGVENTIDEVLNTALAFSRCFIEVIKANEG